MITCNRDQYGDLKISIGDFEKWKISHIWWQGESELTLQKKIVHFQFSSLFEYNYSLRTITPHKLRLITLFNVSKYETGYILSTSRLEFEWSIKISSLTKEKTTIAHYNTSYYSSCWREDATPYLENLSTLIHFDFWHEESKFNRSIFT